MEICQSQRFPKGLGHFEAKLKLRFKGYFSRQYLWTVRYGNGLTTTFLLEVFTQRNFAVDFIRLKITFIQKTKNHVLSHPLGDLRATYALCTPSIGHWKAHGRLSIRHN